MVSYCAGTRHAALSSSPHQQHMPQSSPATCCTPGAYGDAAAAAKQVEREATEAAAGSEADEELSAVDPAVAALHAEFAERQAGLLQV